MVKGPDMIYAHSSHATLKLGSSIFCFTGKNESNRAHTGCEYFDIDQFLWV